MRGDDVCAEERRRNNHRRKCEELRGKPGFWAENLESCCAELRTSRHVTGRKTTNFCQMFSYWRIITLKHTQLEKILIKTMLYLLLNEYFVFCIHTAGQVIHKLSDQSQFSLPQCLNWLLFPAVWTSLFSTLDQTKEAVWGFTLTKSWKICIFDLRFAFLGDILSFLLQTLNQPEPAATSVTASLICYYGLLWKKVALDYTH